MAIYRDLDTGAGIATQVHFGKGHKRETCPRCGHPRHERVVSGKIQRNCEHCRKVRQRLRRVGLSWAAYRELLARFDGRCHLCRHNVATAIDHCHETNEIRGLLCNSCNLLVGWAEKAKPKTVKRMFKYLGWD